MPIFSKKSEVEEPRWTLEKGLLDALVTSVEEAVIVYDSQFKIINFNKAAEKIFGIKAGLVIGKIFSLNKAKGFKSRALAQAMFSSLAPIVVRRSEPGTYPQVLDISLDEPAKELRIVTNKVIDDNGEVWGFVKIIRDRTRELELLKAKSDFITIAAHQLRTPTTGLSWALDSLVGAKNLDKDSRSTLDIARKSARNLLKIINDLISVAQIEEGRFGYNFKKTALTPFIERVLTEAEIIAKQYKVKVYFVRPKEKVNVKMDADKIGMAISNLVDNAIKYNVPNGEVIVKARRLPNKPYIEISVKDTGVGIPEKDLPKLFTKFFRSKNAEKLAVGGSGLGLYLTKNIIERHGGRIWAKSVIGRGSTFTFTLPLQV